MTTNQAIQMGDLVNMEDPGAILEEVKIISESIFPGFDFRMIRNVFSDVVRLFEGQYPGYRACNACYHDLQHTTDIFLAMSRLAHAAFLEGLTFSEWEYNLGIVSALMHDTGYVQEELDTEGTGAKYTLIHVTRSIDFLRAHFSGRGFTEADFTFCTHCLRCTGLDTRIDLIEFSSPTEELLAKMLGTADLLGQMSDRWYLEKLPFLYYEFVEGGVPGYASVFDLLKKTPGFYEFTLNRFATQLGDVVQVTHNHFKTRWGLDRNLYIEAIERNMAYINHVIVHHEEDYPLYLRRGRYMSVLEEKLARSPTLTAASHRTSD